MTPRNHKLRKIMEIVQSIGTTALIMLLARPGVEPEVVILRVAHSSCNHCAFLPGVVSILSHRLFEGALHERDREGVGQNSNSFQRTICTSFSFEFLFQTITNSRSLPHLAVSSFLPEAVPCPLRALVSGRSQFCSVRTPEDPWHRKETGLPG